jgi:hypothetical protein
MPDKVEAAVLLLLMSASIAAVTKNWDVASCTWGRRDRRPWLTYSREGKRADEPKIPLPAHGFSDYLQISQFENYLERGITQKISRGH